MATPLAYTWNFTIFNISWKKIDAKTVYDLAGILLVGFILV